MGCTWLIDGIVHSRRLTMTSAIFDLPSVIGIFSRVFYQFRATYFVIFAFDLMTMCRQFGCIERYPLGLPNDVV